MRLRNLFRKMFNHVFVAMRTIVILIDVLIAAVYFPDLLKYVLGNFRSMITTKYQFCLMCSFGVMF